MNLTLIMPCYNRAYDLLRVLQAYDCQETDTPFELFAVDDASTDETYSVLKNYKPKRYHLTVERMEKNSGQGKARNRVIPQINTPLMMFVGDDMLPQPGLVQGHMDCHRRNSDERLAILGKVEWPPDLSCNSLMSHIDGVGAQQFSYFYMRSGQEYDFRHFYTCNVSVKTSFFKSLGTYFDPGFYLYGYEDVEVGYRLAQKGMRIIYQESMLVQHYHYHNIWAFAKRQRNSGVMVNVLLRKHPRLLAYKHFGLQYWKVLKLWNLPGFRRNVIPKEKLSWLESASCRLASFYEWPLNGPVEALYVALLDYFYYVGVIEGMPFINSEQEYFRSALTRRYLLPHLGGFIKEALKNSTQLPFGYDQNFLRQLS